MIDRRAIRFPGGLMKTAGILCVLAAFPAGSATAQTIDLSGRVEDTLYRLFVPATPETASFLTQLVGQQLATFPASSSSGSFTTIDSENPLMPGRRAAQTYGPLFAERALTLGQRGRMDAGVSIQHTSFVGVEHWEFSSLPLRSIAFSSGIATSTLDLHLAATTVSMFANRALRDNVDIGLTLPLIHIHLQGDIVEREGTQETKVATADTDSSGLGDISLRFKYRPRHVTGENVALATELKLPTGDSKGLLGAGRARLTETFVWAQEGRTISPHVNLAYTGWIGGGPKVAIQTVDPVRHTFGYALGIAAKASGYVTVSADLVGRYLVNAGRLSEQQVEAAPVTVALLPREGDSLLQIGTAGAKVAWRQWLTVAQITFPLSASGLKPGTGFVLGLEREF